MYSSCFAGYHKTQITVEEKGLLSYYLSLETEEAQLLTSGTCLSPAGATSPAIYQEPKPDKLW